ncbi:hypothetical protein OKW98_15720 [Pseudomonas sp. KU26590]|uniref:hypothetical protein n=1 Tax=Pseudomonas sp. KU26590 TaxID=2991051 RepID=UPI00223D20EB|nr:hypothetical protein [Pseudomonas sp. KU26590]UZJ58061.1 hypothetical protein OKW98_15720 [Pseudomonas sp. KU26590]
MMVMFIFLGFLAFLSGYVVSLEARFQRDGLFCPFSLAENLKASPRARKTLTWFGVCLWAVAAVYYVFGTVDYSLSVHDLLKCLGVAVILYVFMSIGYAREMEWKKTGESADSIPPFGVMTRHEKQMVSIKAGLAIAKVIGVLMSLSALKWIASLMQ